MFSIAPILSEKLSCAAASTTKQTIINVSGINKERQEIFYNPAGALTSTISDVLEDDSVNDEAYEVEQFEL